jgi:pimeloyl-ACP methyl ester carboxylesterase
MVVSGRWLLAALAAALAIAAICAYATLALLFYQGQWQLILHPSRAIAATPASRYDEIRFDYTETGVSLLDGWWIPADPGSRLGADTLLYLHGGDGSLSTYAPDLNALHTLGINLFAIDYRGYGRSAGRHPDEAAMTQDANAAWSYLTGTRHIDPHRIVVYGGGVGASLAAELAARHAPAGVILDAASPPARDLIEQDARARVLPLGLLLNQRFDPAETLKTLDVPKLFLDRTGSGTRTRVLYAPSAFPKEYFQVQPGDWLLAVSRFLDEALP